MHADDEHEVGGGMLKVIGARGGGGGTSVLNIAAALSWRARVRSSSESWFTIFIEDGEVESDPPIVPFVVPLPQVAHLPQVVQDEAPFPEFPGNSDGGGTLNTIGSKLKFGMLFVLLLFVELYWDNIEQDAPPPLLVEFEYAEYNIFAFQLFYNLCKTLIYRKRVNTFFLFNCSNNFQ